MDSVAIIGLGYVGLPLACLCARKGLTTFGFDVNKKTVEKINAGISHIADAELERQVRKLKGKISATTDEKVISKASVIVVCVPTPVDEKHHPDLYALKSACSSIARNLKKGQLIIVESTIFPGTTEEVVLPILQESGLKPEKDFFLVHCPERIDPGSRKWGIENIPRVLGGMSKEGTKKAKNFYGNVLKAEVFEMNSVKEAEAVKLTENSFRDVNIAFVNELAKSFDKMGIDVADVIRGASTKPFGFMPFWPGPGVGGHCIAIDPYYLIERAKSKGFQHEFLPLARKINDSMPAFVVGLAEFLTGNLEGKKIACLGIAYKADVDDTRESPALKVVELLKEKRAVVKTFDPFVKSKSNCSSLEEAVKEADCVVLLTAHNLFVKTISAEFLKKNNVKAVVDARNALDKDAISAAGIRFKGIGR
ncbi:MAG: nucleotide sugar dehydrogenase [archaeon GW2011_AR10]|uniref:UDP-N-acetyl-D-mannosamine dehydrogenase n=3 Tax=Candidatus Iainarchaeum sp. TaxID=3101447 RepID=A0A7J4IQP3_9ARCH|nr:MAG: nucleotide sugar dehydrogenase [archaeon GW2011_AR10]HIH07752.1 nucleotide sugar dehydrogenase [Candidatus Diapherotrites archaeon]